MPVVCCGLHSQVPLVAAAAKFARPDARVAYVMTDQASLPLALSDVAARSRAAGLLDATITCGQAFGGEIEAVTLHSGLLAARHVRGADVAIVAIGPGVVGTAHALRARRRGAGRGGQRGRASRRHARRLPAALLRRRAPAPPGREPPHARRARDGGARAGASSRCPALPAEQAAAVEEALETARVCDRHERAVRRVRAATRPSRRCGVRGPHDGPHGRGRTPPSSRPRPRRATSGALIGYSAPGAD